MSTQAVSNVSIFQELQSFYHDRRGDLRQLGTALQAGDVNGAQQAFAALAALGQSGPFSNSEPFSRTDRAQDFAAVGQALQSGDLAGAQAAFAALQQTFGHHQEGGGHNIPVAFVVNLGGTSNGSATGNVADAQSIYEQLQQFRTQRQTDLGQLGQALQSGDANAAQQAFDTLVTLGQNGPFRNSQPFQRADRAHDFAAIGEALQNGDLAGAQQAFAALAGTFRNQETQTAQNQLPPIIINLLEPPTPLPPTFRPPIGTLPPTPLPTTLPPIGTLPPTPLPPTFQPPVSTVPPIVPPTVTPPVQGGGSSTPPEIIINVGGSTSPNGQPGEVVVNVGNGAGPSKPEEVQISFGNNSSGGNLTIDVKEAQNGNSGEQIALNFNPGNTNYQLVLNLFDSLSSSQSQNNSLSLQA